jgi:hypothetical protein
LENPGNISLLSAFSSSTQQDYELRAVVWTPGVCPASNQADRTDNIKEQMPSISDPRTNAVFMHIWWIISLIITQKLGSARLSIY